MLSVSAKPRQAMVISIYLMLFVTVKRSDGDSIRTQEVLM